MKSLKSFLKAGSSVYKNKKRMVQTFLCIVKSRSASVELLQPQLFSPFFGRLLLFSGAVKKLDASFFTAVFEGDRKNASECANGTRRRTLYDER